MSIVLAYSKVEQVEAARKKTSASKLPQLSQAKDAEMSLHVFRQEDDDEEEGEGKFVLC